MSSDEPKPIARIRRGPGAHMVGELPAEKFGPRHTKAPPPTARWGWSWDQACAWVLFRNEALVERAGRESVIQWLDERETYLWRMRRFDHARSPIWPGPTPEYTKEKREEWLQAALNVPVPIYCTLPVVGSREEWQAAIDDHRIFGNEDQRYDPDKVRGLFPARAASDLLPLMATVPTAEPRKRGREPKKRQATVARMRKDIASGSLTAKRLSKMFEKELAAEYGVSRDTARKARKIVESGLSSRQIATNDQ
jgi:hypothetical protein